MVGFNGFVVQFGLVQVSKIVNSPVWTLSNRNEPLPIVTMGSLADLGEKTIKCYRNLTYVGIVIHKTC